MIRAGFAGSGFAAGFHYESILESGLSFIEPHGVFSKTKENREAFAAERGLTSYDSLGELLDNVDVIHVCVPAAMHETVAVEALKRDVHLILEKPFTGYFGPGSQASAAPATDGVIDDVDTMAGGRGSDGTTGPHGRADTRRSSEFKGNEFSKKTMKAGALASARRIVEAEKKSKANIYYAENWVYAPVIQKEAEIIQKTKAQILWMIAEESHSGSHSAAYGVWKLAGGGSLMGKGCHPLTTVLYLKRMEGIARDGKPIRPKAVSSRVHELTRIPGYQDKGYIRTDYTDVEDWGLMHVVFEDGTIADVFSSEIVLGGVHNWLEVFATNHRTRCNINPIDGVQTYNPDEKQLDDVYVVEKIGTKQGWSKPAADENWMNGYVQEVRFFYQCIQKGELPFSYSALGYDTVDVIYSAYLSAERGGAEVAVGE